MVQISDVPSVRRREILEAASSVFRERGFHEAGMREIAETLGVAVGKLYYWFDGKQAILAFCQEDCLRGLLRVADRVDALGCGPGERLHHLVVGHLRQLNEWTPGSLAHLEVESLEGPHRSRILGLRDRYEGRVRRLIADGVRDGTFRDVDPKVTALAVLGAANWSVKWYRPGGRLPLWRIAASFADQLVRGLLSRPDSWQPPDEDPFTDPEDVT